jgi:hypothetical protein
MALTELYEIDGVTVGGTAISVPTGTTSTSSITTDGVYQFGWDPGVLAKGDEFEVLLYEIVEATGATQRPFFRQTMLGAQPQDWFSPSYILMHGWDMRIRKIAGTDRAFDAVIRQAPATVTESYELDNVTVTNTELSVVSGTTSLATDTTDGAYQLWLDGVANMAKGDRFVVKMYEKVEGTGGTKKVVHQWTLANVQSRVFVTPVLILMNGWDFTVTRTAGSNRAFDASIRKVG